MLQFAEYVLTGSLVFIVVALITALVLLSSRGRGVKTVRRERVKVAEKAMAGVAAETHAAPVALAEFDDPVSDDDGTGDEAQSAVGSPTPSRQPKAGGSVSIGALSTGFTIVALVLVTIYLGIRIALTGHGPFANMHEFAVSFAWGILAAYLVTYWRFKIRMISLAVLPVAGALLIYALSVDSGVEPLVPALQNNLLLTLHVGFAIISYGAACVSFGAAVIYLLWPKLKLKTPRDRFDEVGYKASVVTFPMMTVMILLGSLWANIAWGRYWGWDPKETAALVTWLLYAGFLHARVVRGWRGTKSAWLLIIGFAAVIFAYFGNYFFGGLHAY